MTDLIRLIPPRRKTNLNKSNEEQQQFELDKVYDNICQGMEFQILNEPKKKELRSMIIKHGGHVVATATKNTYAIIASREDGPRLRDATNTKAYNIVRSTWVERALGEDKPLTELLKFDPSDMIFSTRFP